jgi:hypothetical protein
MRVTVDLPDELVAEIERRSPNAKWQTIITDALLFALSQADAESLDNQPPDDEATGAGQT